MANQREEKAGAGGGSRGQNSYHRSQKALLALAKFFQCILFVGGTFDDLVDAFLANIIQYRLHLFHSGGFLGDVELKGITTRFCLGRVVARLVEGGAGLGIGRDLLHEVGDAGGCRRRGLVEDGDDVEAFVLRARRWL